MVAVRSQGILLALGVGVSLPWETNRIELRVVLCCVGECIDN